MPIGRDFEASGNCQCRDCGFVVDIVPGRAWKVTKGVLRQQMETGDYYEEVVTDQIFSIRNRFIVKCHRPSGGYACVLCARYRDKDTLLESPQGLVRHIQNKHEIHEYNDPDIIEIG
jgi:hypothetical protein